MPLKSRLASYVGAAERDKMAMKSHSRRERMKEVNEWQGDGQVHLVKSVTILWKAGCEDG